jgi:hypothetical protein
VPETVVPSIGPVNEDVQEKVVAAIDDVGKKPSASWLHICREKSEAELVITGTAVTVAVTFSGVPAHPFDSGVIRYTTVPVDTASALESTCPMTFPEPAAAPLTFVLLCTIHVNVVPATLFGFVIAIEVDEPEQIP